MSIHPLGIMNLCKKVSEQTIQQLLRYLSLDQVEDQTTDRHCQHVWKLSHGYVPAEHIAMDVFLHQHHTLCRSRPSCRELITSCQRFWQQVFIYQALVFPWTWQSCSRCEGQQGSHILIKVQGAKNKSPPAGTTLRLKEMWKGSEVHTY